jgi:hypothetical protein
MLMGAKLLTVKEAVENMEREKIRRKPMGW